MKYVKKRLSDLKPYENNTRKKCGTKKRNKGIFVPKNRPHPEK